MSIKKFEQNDLFLNTVKTTPHCKFSIHNTKVFYKKNFGNEVPDGFAGIFDLNLSAQGAIVTDPMLDFSIDTNSMYVPLI